MLQNAFSFINSIHPLDEDLAADIQSRFEVMEVPARHKLLEDGQTCKHLYLLVKGIARIFYIKGDEEVCSLIVEENYPFTASDSFFTGKPGYQFIETLEPAIIARIHIQDLQVLYAKYREANLIARVITEKYFVKSEERLFLLRKKSAEDRYLYFMEKYPSMVLRVPLKHIASYLGMTLETLSRCRKKLRTK